MQHNENTMYAYVYKDLDGTDNTLIATIDNQEKPLVSNCLDEIKNMSNLAIDLAAQFEEGTHYKILDVAKAEKPIVTEFFSLSTAHTVTNSKG